MSVGRRLRPIATLLILTLALLAGGGIFRAVRLENVSHILWLIANVVGLGSAIWWIVDAARHRHLGADAVALLALVGTIVVKEYLAGALIAVMLATGRELEDRAAARARRDLSLLVERTPRRARVYRDHDLVLVPVDEVKVGELVLIPPGEVVPVDGLVEQGEVVIDESALTGESLPRRMGAGDRIRSGTVNGGGAFEVRVTTRASEGTYASIVRLVKEAERSQSPVTRLADRYALWFVIASTASGALAWAISGELSRAVAVFVVATPCPLVLAVPVAIFSGLALSARSGVIIKGGAVLERLAMGGTLLLDKTGTLTTGVATVADIETQNGADPNQVLRLAASVDQVSPHVLAASIVTSARNRGLILDFPKALEETTGMDIRGLVDDQEVRVGRATWVSNEHPNAWMRAVRRRASIDNLMTVFVSVDGHVVGTLLMEDPIRLDAARTLRNLRRDGFRRVVMVTGDRSDIAESVGSMIGVDAVFAERSPSEKVDVVALERRKAQTIMVGDGINDAPALALADVGVALAAHGVNASSEASDVVLTVDRLESLGDAVLIARRSRRLAAMAAFVGVGCSIVAMAVAGIGWLSAAWGALLQEGIDVVAIGIALTTLFPVRIAHVTEEEQAVLGRFSEEDALVNALLARIRQVASHLGQVDALDVLEEARAVYDDLVAVLEPMQIAEEGELYPVVARIIGGADPTSYLLRAHAEIRHDVLRIKRLLDSIESQMFDPQDIDELQRLYYDLYALVRLHFAQERESYLSILGPREVVSGGQSH